MKKIIITGILLMGIIIAGCEKNEKKSNVSEEKIYKVGTSADYEPYEYRSKDKIVGFDIELMEAISKKVGFKFEIVDMTFDGLIPALQTGKIDILIAAMTVTEDRKKAVNFSTPYNSSAITFLTSNNAIKDMNDLENKKYGVQLGTTQEEAARRIEGSNVVTYTTSVAAILDLKTKKIHGVVVDESVANKFIDSNPELTLIGSLPADEKALAVSKKFDEKVLNKINKAIVELIEDGTIHQLEKKYNLK